MKIGIISTVGGYAWAGSEELWYGTALMAVQQGHHVEVLLNASMKNAHQIKNLQSLGVKVTFRTNYGHPRLDALQQLIYSDYNQWIARQDIILVSAGSLINICFLPGLISSLLKCTRPYFLLCQFNADIQTFSVNERNALKTLYQRSAGQIFVSQHNLILAQRQLAISIPGSKVIYNPIRFYVDEPLMLPETEKVQLACVARLETLWKGHDVLLEVLSKKSWQERNWHLNIYGGGPDLPYIQQLIDHFGLSARVTLHGYVGNVMEVWRKNHLMVLASRGEGLPLAVLEALMCGRPVVTTDVGGNREIIDEGMTGWVSDVASTASFGAVLEEAWQQQDKWGQMGKAAHATAVKIAKEEPCAELLSMLTGKKMCSNNRLL